MFADDEFAAAGLPDQDVEMIVADHDGRGQQPQIAGGGVAAQKDLGDTRRGGREFAPGTPPSTVDTNTDRIRRSARSGAV
ncbi:hypothetical protein [Nocardia pseudobrasiliensis]|uniref:hypothetical protein n=1 Tax=Nocardia pseudobrasiliensis TaxID=45979 RepID=UPI00082F71AD|nr:hypothetical protein [Nocardia pseudobrasiliensis]